MVTSASVLLTDLYYIQTEYYFDFAGSGVVHLLGATCSIIGCYFMGPRIGRFEVTHQHFRSFIYTSFSVRRFISDIMNFW